MMKFLTIDERTFKEITDAEKHEISQSMKMTQEKLFLPRMIPNVPSFSTKFNDFTGIRKHVGKTSRQNHSRTKAIQSRDK